MSLQKRSFAKRLFIDFSFFLHNESDCAERDSRGSVEVKQLKTKKVESGLLYFLRKVKRLMDEGRDAERRKGGKSAVAAGAGMLGWEKRSGSISSHSVSLEREVA